MFKPGQLVRSRKYGDLYVVESRVSRRDGWLWCRPLVRKHLDRLLFEPERLELIGNNYKAK